MKLRARCTFRLLTACLLVASFSGNLRAEGLILDSLLTISSPTTFDSVVIQSAGILTADAKITCAGSFRVQSGGIVTHTVRYTAGLVLNVSGTLTVASGGSIDVTGKGLLGGPGGSAVNRLGEAYDPVTGAIVRVTPEVSGGSYGGLGGGQYSPVYGDERNPTQLGSGGGGGAWLNGQPGGTGGGAVVITASVLVLNGSIRADGGMAPGPSSGGGGSGGTVNIDVGEWSGAGQITANGGSALTGLGSSSGGGGRIAVQYQTRSYIGTYLARGTARINQDYSAAGTAGTIYLKDKGAAYGDLIIDNGGVTGFNNANVTLVDVYGARTFRNVDVRNQGQLRIDTTMSSFMVKGSLEVLGSSRLERLSSWIQSGGQIIVDSTSILIIHDSLHIVEGAILSGSGTIEAIVANSGLVAPGYNSTGCLTIDGNYIQAPEGTMSIKISGPDIGVSYDQLKVSNFARLGGSVSLSIADGYQPTGGSHFWIVSCPDVTDTFVSLTGCDTSLYGLTYTKTGVMLNAGSNLLGNSTTDNVAILSPSGATAFNVLLRDMNNNPVIGSLDAWLDFSDANAIIPCASNTTWPLVYPSSPSGPDGSLTFRVGAGGCSQDSMKVMSSHGPIAKVPVRSLDINGGLLVTASDFTGGICNDYNNDGVIDSKDWDFFVNYLGQTCIDVPANYTNLTVFTIPGPGAIYQGDTIQVCAKVVNTLDENMVLDSVIFATANWGISLPWTEFGRFTSTTLNRLDSVTLCKPFLVPPAGHGCFQVHIYPRFLETVSKSVATLMPTANDSVVYGVRKEGGNYWAYIGISNGQELGAVQYDSVTEIPDYSTARFLGETQAQLLASVGMDQSANIQILQSDIVGTASSLWMNGFPGFAGTQGELQILNGISGDLAFARSKSTPRGQNAVNKQKFSICEGNPSECSGPEPSPDGCSCLPNGDWKRCCDLHDLCYFAGGSDWDRRKCDLALRDCIGGALGDIGYVLVRIWGGSHFCHRPIPPANPTPGKVVQLNVDAQKIPSGSRLVGRQKDHGSNQSASVSSPLQRDTVYLFNIPVGNSNGDSLIILVNSFLPPGWKYYLNRSGLILTPDTISGYIIPIEPVTCQDTGRIIISAYTMSEQYAGNAEVMVVGDTCDYVCGDADGEGTINIADAVFLINYIFVGGPAPQPLAAGDVDCGGTINIADVVYLINYIFSHGAQPCAGCK